MHPMLVPAIMSTGIWCSSNHCSAPISLIAGAPPPPSATPIEGRPFGFGGSAAYFNYTHISLDAYTAFGTPPAGTFSSIDIELVGGSGAAAYDAKIVCATYPSADTPADLINGFNQYVCIVPAYGSASGTYTTTYNATEGKFVETGPTGTGSENTFATGLVTLQSPTLYVDVVVTAPSAASTGNTLGIANVVATQ